MGTDGSVGLIKLSKFDAMKKKIKNEFWYDVLFS